MTSLASLSWAETPSLRVERGPEVHTKPVVCIGEDGQSRAEQVNREGHPFSFEKHSSSTNHSHDAHSSHPNKLTQSGMPRSGTHIFGLNFSLSLKRRKLLIMRQNFAVFFDVLLGEFAFYVDVVPSILLRWN